MHFYAEAITIGQGEVNTHIICDLRISLAYTLHHQGRDASALEELTKCVTVARACDCQTCLSRALSALALVEGNIGDTPGADAHYREAIAVAKVKSEGMPVLVNADYLLFQAEGADTIERAAELVSQADAIYEALGNDWGRLCCVNTMAEAFTAAGAYDSAIEQYAIAAPLVAEQDAVRGENSHARALAKVHILAGNPKAAIPLITANGWVAQDGAITSRDRALHLAVYCDALVAAGERQTALQQCERLIVAIAGQEWHDLEGRAHWVRAQALQHQDPAGAERASQRAMALLLKAGKFELAENIGTSQFIEPYETLAKIDIDNQMRAEAQEAERRVRDEAETLRELEVVAATALSDPIEDQVNRPMPATGAEPDAGIA